MTHKEMLKILESYFTTHYPCDDKEYLKKDCIELLDILKKIKERGQIADLRMELERTEQEINELKTELIEMQNGFDFVEKLYYFIVKYL